VKTHCLGYYRAAYARGSYGVRRLVAMAFDPGDGDFGVFARLGALGRVGVVVHEVMAFTDRWSRDLACAMGLACALLCRGLGENSCSWQFGGRVRICDDG
jgi:hypothetical protein